MNQYNNAALLVDMNQLPAGHINEHIQRNPKNVRSKIEFQGVIQFRNREGPDCICGPKQNTFDYFFSAT